MLTVHGTRYGNVLAKRIYVDVTTFTTLPIPHQRFTILHAGQNVRVNHRSLGSFFISVNPPEPLSKSRANRLATNIEKAVVRARGRGKVSKTGDKMHWDTWPWVPGGRVYIDFKNRGVCLSSYFSTFQAVHEVPPNISNRTALVGFANAMTHRTIAAINKLIDDFRSTTGTFFAPRVGLAKGGIGMVRTGVKTPRGNIPLFETDAFKFTDRSLLRYIKPSVLSKKRVSALRASLRHESSGENTLLAEALANFADGGYRQAVIFCNSFIEIMASKALRSALSKHFDPALLDAWLRDTSLLEKLTIWLHTVYGRGLNSQQGLLKQFREARQIRNRVIHDGKDPTFRETRLTILATVRLAMFIQRVTRQITVSARLLTGALAETAVSGQRRVGF